MFFYYIWFIGPIVILVRLIIWFITTVVLANTIDLPIVFLEYTQNTSSLLFVVSLAAIGFKIELNEIKQTAWQVITTVLFANMLLLIIAGLGINLLHLD